MTCQLEGLSMLSAGNTTGWHSVSSLRISKGNWSSSCPQANICSQMLCPGSGCAPAPLNHELCTVLTGAHAIEKVNLTALWCRKPQWCWQCPPVWPANLPSMSSCPFARALDLYCIVACHIAHLCKVLQPQLKTLVHALQYYLQLAMSSRSSSLQAGLHMHWQLQHCGTLA